jgi:Cgr1 family
MDAGVASSSQEADTDAVPPKRPRHMGIVSGRVWKPPAQRASALRNQVLGSTWEKKMQLRAQAKLFKEAKAEARAAHKANLDVRLVANLCVKFYLQSQKLANLS